MFRGSIPRSGVRPPKSRVRRFNSLTKFPIGVGSCIVNTDNDDDGSIMTSTCCRIKIQIHPNMGDNKISEGVIIDSHKGDVRNTL